MDEVGGSSSTKSSHRPIAPNATNQICSPHKGVKWPAKRVFGYHSRGNGCRFRAGKQGDRSSSEDSFVRDRKRAGPPVRRSSRSSNQEQHHNRYHREAGACFSTPWPRQISSKPRTNRRLLPSHRRKGSAIPSSEPHQAVAALRNQSRTSGRLQRSSIDPNVRPPFR